MKQNHWKLLADLNISVRTVQFLQTQGIDILRVDKTVSTDQEIFELAKSQGRGILTFDKDFGEIFYFSGKKECTIILHYLYDQRSAAVNKIIGPFLQKNDFLAFKNKLVILYENRVRTIE